MMDKIAVLGIVKAQLASEYGCLPKAFDIDDNTFILSEDKHFFKIATFGKGAVIHVHKDMYNWCVENLSHLKSKEIMDGDILFRVEERLRNHGKKLTGIHERYLFFPSQVNLKIPKDVKLKWFEREEIAALYSDIRFTNALAYKKHDVLAVVAYINDEIAAIAGTDDYKQGLWQIGIDTMPSYRQRGLASYLVNLLAMEIVERGAIPYYTTWSANLASTWVALKSGFFPSWIEFFAKDIEPK